jgi:hypothetical protein
LKVLADAPGLLQVKTPVVLNLSGTKVVLWQRDDEAGLFKASRTVTDGSSITHHNVTSAVDVGTSAAAVSSHDPRLARIAAIQAAQAALEEELAALSRSSGA